jgi:hypothetical protein
LIFKAHLRENRNKRKEGNYEVQRHFSSQDRPFRSESSESGGGKGKQQGIIEAGRPEGQEPGSETSGQKSPAAAFLKIQCATEQVEFQTEGPIFSRILAAERSGGYAKQVGATVFVEGEDGFFSSRHCHKGA